MRLIDADALSALFDERNSDTFIQYKTRENKDYWWGVNSGINWGTNTITDAPTVDAVPVVHGRWIETEEGTICSECNKHPFEDGEYAIANYKSNYCPNCGADMRERKVK